MMDKIKIAVDTHTHTTASGHAYGTLKENAEAARENGLAGFVCSDHGPLIPGAAPPFIITAVLARAPEEIEGVRLFPGAEADITDAEGTLDIADEYLAATRFAIASLHTIAFPPSDRTSNTDAMLGALANPWIDCVGHPGNPRYPIDPEAFVMETKRRGKVVEINNHSFLHRTGSEANCRRIIRLCKERDVPIVISSDAHTSYAVGRVPLAIQAAEEEGFPEELVMNARLDRFLGYLRERRAQKENHGA